MIAITGHGKVYAAFALLAGILMLASPRLFFGRRDYDAHDPRTVRFFGGAIFVFTLPVVGYSLYQLVTE